MRMPNQKQFRTQVATAQISMVKTQVILQVLLSLHELGFKKKTGVHKVHIQSHVNGTPCLSPMWSEKAGFTLALG